MTLVRPHAARRAARFFVEHFPGQSLYAVKANPSPGLIATLWSAGITHFDVASLGEIRLVQALLPGAKLCFMNPVKSEHAITEAYFRYGVKTFSLDCPEELEKIKRATRGAADLELFVRLRVSSEYAKQSLAAKFGVASENAADLLAVTRQMAHRLGVSFHVGSQSMSPLAYAKALARVRLAMIAASVTVDTVDVGGGFPSVYPGMEPPRLDKYFQAIKSAFNELPTCNSTTLWAEPGRALCAEYTSLLVRVQKRRDHELFINDGVYGALSEAGHLGWRFPVAPVRDTASDSRAPFTLYGPTCDELDKMAGPFMLPMDMAVGDYIEVGMLGAYGCAMRTQFNGFGSTQCFEVEDEPMASLYTRDSPVALAQVHVPGIGMRAAPARALHFQPPCEAAEH